MSTQPDLPCREAVTSCLGLKAHAAATAVAFLVILGWSLADERSSFPLSLTIMLLAAYVLMFVLPVGLIADRVRLEMRRGPAWVPVIMVIAYGAVSLGLVVILEPYEISNEPYPPRWKSFLGFWSGFSLPALPYGVTVAVVRRWLKPMPFGNRE
jgi:hypothetical protein